jgi:DNA-binding transcriptional ArsR family regulator
MVNYQPDLDATFSALGDPTRRAILARLASGEHTVGELAQPFAMSLPAISRHLRVLESARLISRTREGRALRCKLEIAPMNSALQWIAGARQFWEHQLDLLEQYLTKTQEEENAWRARRRLRNTNSASRAPSRSRASGSGARGRKRRS